MHSNIQTSNVAQSGPVSRLWQSMWLHCVPI